MILLELPKESNTSIVALLIPLIVAMIAQIGTIFKIIYDKRSAKKDSGLIIESVRGLENTIVKQGMKIEATNDKLDGLIKDNDFINEFKNCLRMKSTQIINMSRVTPCHRSVLNYFSQLLEEFGLRFYYSSYRKSTEIGKTDLREYLETDFEIKRTYLRKYIDENIREIRYIRGQKTTFLDLMLKSKASAKAELLIETLVRNGLSAHDVVKHFEHFLIEYFNIYLDTVTLWETLESNYNESK